uniref:Zinc finger protein RFP-like n=1 Tax=Chelonoidis abingdonii TaxID=106734 RepID=A0A8C0IRB4_CHEAB
MVDELLNIVCQCETVEATCPICLEYFKDPVTIECGHNFCRACIAQCWEGSDTAVSCPQCRETGQQGNLRPNRQLANVVEIVKRLSLQTAKGAGEERVCGEHQETLKLFCEEDQTPICVICRESRAHRAHTVVPIREAAQDKSPYKPDTDLIPCFMDRDPVCATQHLAHVFSVPFLFFYFQGKVKNRREMIAGEFNQLHTLLREEEQLLLQTPAPGPDSVTLSPVDVTLDPDTANPNLILSEDRKRVRLGDKRQDLPNNPERFDPSSCVLGTEGFAGGRRYWEVEVGDKMRWDLGVCRESVRRKGWVIATPEDGYWVVRLWDGEYQASTSPPTSLPVSVRPSRVGIFLDYKAGEVSFYNVTDRSHLVTFTDTFSGKLRPYFCPGHNSKTGHLGTFSPHLPRPLPQG